MAYALALSLKLTQPEGYDKLSIGVTRKELKKIPSKYREVFDEIVEIPWKDHAAKSSWKLENEWKTIHMTPYEETIKLDADMLFPADISSWWNLLGRSEGVFCTKPQTYRGEIITSDFYRKTFTESQLPNIYTAFFYFKKTPANFELFELAETIFNNWERFFYEFLEPEHRPTYVSTDVVFAIASKILDYSALNMTPFAAEPTFVHMKSQLQGWSTGAASEENWMKVIPSYLGRDCNMMIGNYRQTVPVHYHIKDFVSDRHLINLERMVGV
jgi:hypothetical protein